MWCVGRLQTDADRARLITGEPLHEGAKASFPAAEGRTYTMDYGPYLEWDSYLFEEST